MSQENHNHITRDIKPPGQCYSCDRYHALSGARHVTELRNVIYGTLELWEDSAQDAHTYLTQEAQARGIDRYENG
ncbi:hypothetical protein SEA_CECE_191 [Microbacterium phage Cece]|nr:hypothetical protein SEA_CECE_191 [Microbacterium phage Cece]